ncbi:MAG: TIGR04255 family protein [Methylacidiphilaceae bacterium]|nr:TIGR04255 family protein [Candidatus Methylacidiphilaceae bacterium]
MRNAPVYFAVTQARHNPVLRLEAYAADIQDRLRRAGYTDFKEETTLAFSGMPPLGGKGQISAPQIYQVKRLMFFSPDRTKSFIAEPSAISFHTTEYETFGSFVEEFLKCAGIVHECVQLAFTERIGLRYLDAVVPPNGEEGLPDYLVPGVLGLRGGLPKDVHASHSFSETRIRTQECSVLARTLIQDGRLGFPMDLRSNGVTIADRFSRINGVHAIVDIDASIEERQVFDLGAIESRLQTLQKGVGLAFNAMVTPSALHAWDRRAIEDNPS